MPSSQLATFKIPAIDCNELGTVSKYYPVLCLPFWYLSHHNLSSMETTLPDSAERNGRVASFRGALLHVSSMELIRKVRQTAIPHDHAKHICAYHKAGPAT
ncbi:hypothetical protein BDP27DRAFT_1427224 [Rhodocollybia butyracea]|uniref:Uncharacterized protein n=1 Tax=Rhodocollybia butyracea TaxID=206335 RepID=A0A9P5U1Q2_9AGAR|nr:hypothetical protein BDP27DRAFT_1427224 [Rhodocollybia butyracea]